MNNQSSGAAGAMDPDLNRTRAACAQLFVIYQKPLDFPEHFVVRPHFMSDDQSRGDLVPGPPGTEKLANTLEEARALVPPGLVRIPRHFTDAPTIVESWL